MIILLHYSREQCSLDHRRPASVNQIGVLTAMFWRGCSWNFNCASPQKNSLRWSLWILRHQGIDIRYYSFQLGKRLVTGVNTLLATNISRNKAGTVIFASKSTRTITENLPNGTRNHKRARFTYFYGHKNKKNTWCHCLDFVLCSKPKTFFVRWQRGFRRNSKWDYIFCNILIKYMDRQTRTIKNKIEEKFSDRFFVVVEGWTTSCVHYVSVFTTYPMENKVGYNRMHLTISPMEDETSQSAQAHYEVLNFVLSVYNKRLSNVSAIA